jgi:hypothetical protein
MYKGVERIGEILCQKGETAERIGIALHAKMPLIALEVHSWGPRGRIFAEVHGVVVLAEAFFDGVSF